MVCFPGCIWQWDGMGEGEAALGAMEVKSEEQGIVKQSLMPKCRFLELLFPMKKSHLAFVIYECRS